MSEWKRESAHEAKNTKINQLEMRVKELEVERATHLKKITELEQWIMCLSDSALVSTGNAKDS